MIRVLQLVMKEFLAREMLRPTPGAQWSVQGMGMLRYYAQDLGRIHIWDAGLRYPGVSMIHSHAWDLDSTIVSGRLFNTRFLEPTYLCDPSHYKKTIITGYNCREATPARYTTLIPLPAEERRAGEQYSQRACEIHRTDAADGTITVMQRREIKGDHQADVFWELGSQWGSAQPRPATDEEVQITLGVALHHLDLELGMEN